ncbi:branched-chain amino acid ABC transporter permease [Ferrimicrobium sp.]|uniref:branched-chain amino acid ABC transporter permease n=1 Tax=Ferrimicrobium sp. TaxID=2926050 RepID=UPI0026151A43|nr:branched-chain amino acid ABC transporter permease [Ferrimicrobium sp.]
MLFEFAVIGGILLGIYYALFAMGLNVVFGAQRIINLAHGDIVVLGGYAAWELYETAHVSPIIAAVVVLPFAIALGFLVHRYLTPRLTRSSDPETLSLILFFGLSQVIEAAASLIFGPNEHSLPTSALPVSSLHLFGESYPGIWWVAVLVSIPMLAVFLWLLYRTPFGLRVRAVMSSASEAATAGIESRLVSGLFFGIGFGLAAAAGTMGIFIFGGIAPTDGVALTITAFAIIVFGSLGNPVGTVIAALIFGVVTQLAQVYAPSWSNLVPYALVILTMLLRPQGLLGRRQRVA